LLEAKAEVTESVIRQQLHERCNSTSGLNDMLQQVTASVTTTSQRVEATAAQRCEAMEARFDAEVTALEMSLSARFLPYMEECRATQQHLVKSAEEAEARTRERTESIHADLSRQLTALSEKTNKSLAVVTGRLQDLELRKNDLQTLVSVLRADVLKNSDVTTRRFDNIAGEMSALSRDLQKQTLAAESKHKRLVSLESRIRCFEPNATGVRSCLAPDISTTTAPLEVSRCCPAESCSVVDTDEGSDTQGDAEKPTGDLLCVIQELCARFDEAKQENGKEINSLKTTIGTIEQSFSTLDIKVTRSLEAFTENIKILQTQTCPVQACVAGLKGNLQRLRADTDNIQSIVASQDTRVKDVNASIVTVVDLLREIQERQENFDEWQTS